MRGRNIQLIHHRDHVGGEGGDGEGTRGGRAAGALEIGPNHAEEPGERSHLRIPGVAGAAEAVDHDHRVAVAMLLDRD